MSSPATDNHYLDIDELRIGLFVHLDLGWMKHPFALGSFKIATEDEIATIRQLGLKRVRWSPEKSDLMPEVGTAPVLEVAPRGTSDSSPTKVGAGDTALAGQGVPVMEEAPAQSAPANDPVAERRARLNQQRASLELCERQFATASRQFRKILDNAAREPVAARELAIETVGGMVGKLLEQEESAIRLLSENVGDKGALHPVNVCVISLLLGRCLGLDSEALRYLGTGALLHDIGKTRLPERLRWFDPLFSKTERAAYEEHVKLGVDLGRTMELPPEVLVIIGQHHEFADGTGYPAGVAGEVISRLARIVALVNHYDTLCNPPNPVVALTPHEALAHMYAQMRAKFDSALMMPFVRMMGVYPPGSIVELNDGRYAMVVSVNSSRPLKPLIVIHEPKVPRDEALIHDLEQCPALGIRRSLKPLQLPKVAFDYLSPRQRTCYFFERAQMIGESDE